MYIEALLLIFFTVLMLCIAIFLIESLTGLVIVRKKFQLTATNPIVIVPLSSFIALFVVLFLRYATGPVEIEGLGFRFRGASGPIILWIICFLAVAYGFHLVSAII